MMDVFLISQNGEICREASDELEKSEGIREETTSILPPLCQVGTVQRNTNFNSTIVSLPDHVSEGNTTKNNNNGGTTRSNAKTPPGDLGSSNDRIILPNNNNHKRNSLSSRNLTQKDDSGPKKIRKPRRRPPRGRCSVTQDPERFKAGVYRQIVGRRNGLDMGRVRQMKHKVPDKATAEGGLSTIPDSIMSTDSNTATPGNMLSPNPENSLIINENTNKAYRRGLSATMELTIEQIKAFREVFDLFDSNGGGTIDAHELDATLRSVNICLEPGEIDEVLTLIDKDGNGEIDFHEFLQLMTNTKRFLASLSTSTNNQGTSKGVNREALLFEALTEFMKKSALHSMDEIVGYYNTKYKRVQTPHVVNHYAAGARLIGLNEKQLREHLEKLKATNRTTPNDSLKSPYAQPVHFVASTNNLPSVLSDDNPNRGVIRLTVNMQGMGDEANGKGDWHGRCNKKPKGWVSQRTEHIDVQLPPVHFKDLGPFDELTAEDLPKIRTHVTAACKEYTAGRRKSQFENNLRHWKSLATSQIRPPVLRGYFREVFSDYTALDQSILTV